MLELQKVTKISKTISEYLIQRHSKKKLPSTSSDNRHVRVISQEKDGSILYTWDDVSEVNEGAVVTHFGLYDPVSQKHQMVHTYNQRVHVVSCSINQERTLMAFTTLSREPSGPGEKTMPKEKFSAFLAELKAQSPRVFSLNLERSAFLKVQFLYDGRSADKETHMLVMLHRESIGLYKIPLARVGKGMVMRGQPNTKQVAKKFVWCQWDGPNQQLFYVHHRKDGDGARQALFSSVQFYDNGQYENVLDVPLNFQFHCGRSTYADIPFHSGIPDTSVNACVLTQSNGTFCICYQPRVYPSERKSKSSPLPRTSPLHRNSPMPRTSPYQDSSTGSEGDSTDIRYYICMVHHAKTLNGFVSNIPSNIVKKATVSFSWLGDTILVMLPGYFVHLLNVSIEFEPCNHVLLHSKTCLDTVGLQSQIQCETDNQAAMEAENQSQGSTGSLSASDVTAASWELESVLPVLGLMAEHLVFIGQAVPLNLGKDIVGNYVFERGSTTVYRISINTASLVEVFTECYMPMTRLALLHYTILRTRDLKLLKQLFLVLSNDIASSELPGLMTEFLIAMTYSSMRRQSDREGSRLLPFSSAEPFRGQFDKTADGEWLTRVSYSTIQSVNIVSTTAKERQQRRSTVSEDSLDLLRRHLRWTQLAQTHRFSHSTVTKAYKQLQVSNAKSKQGSTEEENFVAMARMQRSRTRSRSGSETVALANCGGRFDSVLGIAPLFLQGNFITEQSEKLVELTREVVAKHLQMYMNKDAKLKASNMAKEYTNCQIQQSRLLCHLLWSLRGPDVVSNSIESSLNLLEGQSPEEYELFQLLERFWLVVKETAFPVPQKLPTYMTSLAFKCLDRRMFFQYVDYGVLELTGEFMAQILTDLPNDAEHCKIKQYLISKLPQSSVEACYKLWDHTECSHYFAHQQVGEILNADTSLRSLSESVDMGRRPTMRQESNSAVDNVNFKPLASFLSHISKLDSRRSKRERDSPFDMSSLKEMALYHTTHETDYDMGTVNF